MIKPTILALAIAAIFSSCSKETTPTPASSPRKMNTYYFTSQSSESSKSDLTLFIDGVEKGTLPAIAQKPDPNSATQKSIALHSPVSSGSHTVEARKADGTVVSSSIISFSRHKTELSSGANGDGGYCEMASNKDEETIMIEMH